MIDLRKYIIDPEENDFCRLIKTVMRRTTCDCLDRFGELAQYDEDVLYSVAMMLDNDPVYSFELDDYGNWGNELNVCSEYAMYLSPLLYAIITSIYRISDFEAVVINGSTAEFADCIFHPEQYEIYEDWMKPMFDVLADAYQNELEFTAGTLYDEDTSGTLVAVRFFSGPDPTELMNLLGFGEASEDVYYMDVILNDGSYTMSGLQMDIERHASLLADLIEADGFEEHRNVTNQMDIAAMKIGIAYEPCNEKMSHLIEEAFRVKEAREVIMV